ncbi:sugar-binding domain-containing protein [uncultured Varibaculum sp.]|uniref:sugar-binding transcriptional regulator n=1 Tax=uncultured Varibaculum sp. TaxID=413896 RepID=UPI002889E2A0|nr:sugar-binding domain-containing protein [uncultured Varibaculum sp.]
MSKDVKPTEEHFSEENTTRDELARSAALAYYVQGQTMEAIRRRMGVSRSTVSRLLSYARKRGIVTISVQTNNVPHTRLERQLQERFGVNVHIVEMPPDTTQNRVLENVTKTAAQILGQLVNDGEIVGIAWGNTTTEMAGHITQKDVDNVTLVQLNGAASTETSGIAHVGGILARMAYQWKANIVQFPVPAFFDNPDTKEALWREGAVRRVLNWQEKCTLAVFSVGALRAEIPSHVYAAGYLSRSELNKLALDKVVGDVCTVLIRPDGSWSDISLNRRATGPTPDQLRRIPRRFCVVAGKTKAQSLLGALNAGVATDLVCDKAIAEKVWALAKS